jgi:hypothetical protein
MKQTTLRWSAVAVGVLVLSAATVDAQPGLRKGFKAGRTQARVTGNRFDETRSLQSFCGGVSLEFGFLGIFDLEADILYTTKGCRATTANKEAEARLNYLSIPMVLKKKFLPLGVHPYVEGGLEFGSILSATFDGQSIKNDLYSNETALLLGGGIEFGLIGRGVCVEGRYSQGLDNLFKQDTAGNAKTRTTQLLIGIFF